MIADHAVFVESCKKFVRDHECVYMLQICSVVFLWLALNSFKVKQMVNFFCIAIVEQVHAELISKKY